MADLDELTNAMIEIEEEKVYSLTKSLLETGTPPEEIIIAMRKAVNVIGEKFESKEYFLTELVMGGEIFTQASELIKPYLKPGDDDKKIGTIVIGTVSGDVHDIGKNIFSTLCETAGFLVYDLGVDVPIEKFVETVKEVKPQVIGYSGLLTIALDEMKATTEALKDEGLRDGVKIIVGGLPVDETWQKIAGADAFTDSAFEGLKIVKQWVGVD
jgi:methanogenic corrinoid protein MtbC1